MLWVWRCFYWLQKFPFVPCLLLRVGLLKSFVYRVRAPRTATFPQSSREMTCAPPAFCPRQIWKRVAYDSVGGAGGVGGMFTGSGSRMQMTSGDGGILLSRAIPEVGGPHHFHCVLCMTLSSCCSSTSCILLINFCLLTSHFLMVTVRSLWLSCPPLPSLSIFWSNSLGFELDIITNFPLFLFSTTLLRYNLHTVHPFKA